MPPSRNSTILDLRQVSALPILITRSFATEPASTLCVAIIYVAPCHLKPQPIRTPNSDGCEPPQPQEYSCKTHLLKELLVVCGRWPLTRATIWIWSSTIRASRGLDRRGGPDFLGGIRRGSASRPFGPAMNPSSDIETSSTTLLITTFRPYHNLPPTSSNERRRSSFTSLSAHFSRRAATP